MKVESMITIYLVTFAMTPTTVDGRDDNHDNGDNLIRRDKVANARRVFDLYFHELYIEFSKVTRITNAATFQPQQHERKTRFFIDNF